VMAEETCSCGVWLKRLRCRFTGHAWEELTVAFHPETGEILTMTPANIQLVYALTRSPPCGLRCSRCKHVSWHP